MYCMSIDAHNIWKSCGQPRSGEIFMQMKRAKVAYKNAVRAHQRDNDLYISNDLHECLMEKDMVNFWKTWNAKFPHARPPSVIDGTTDESIIAHKFANFFQQANDAGEHISHNADKLAVELQQYIDCAGMSNLKLLDVETVCKCLARMKKGKAPGVDGIETEHLLYAHPIVTVLLCLLFNIMLKHGTVPRVFSDGIIVPVLKDRNGDHTDMNNYRAITLSSCISKLFEMCLIEISSDVLYSSPLQFGFQKKTGCSHALYSLRNVVDFYCAGGSTVNIALLDMSKAFDRVNHNVLFSVLMKRGMSPVVLQLLMTWYRYSNAFVRWGTSVSHVFPLTVGVRQGGVLSPLLFNVYVDSFIQRLKMSNLGCRIGSCYLGCIMYADDLILAAPSLCVLQQMVNICIDEASHINMQFNPRKCSVIRFGPRYLKECQPITMSGKQVAFVSDAKYLGVTLSSYKKFRTGLRSIKSKFYCAFNGLFHHASKLRDELVVLHLVTANCKPHLLYATEALNLNVTQRRSLSHAWQSAVSHIFNVCGDNVQFICNMTESTSLHDLLVHRNIEFLDNIQKFHVTHYVLNYLFCSRGKRELNV